MTFMNPTASLALYRLEVALSGVHRRQVACLYTPRPPQ
jgi:hypothetical protein